MNTIMASPVPQKEDVERWTVEQVAAWLRQMELADCCEFFLRRGIDGRSLMEMNEERLMILGRDISVRNRKNIIKLVKQIENQYLLSTGRLQQNKLNINGRYDQGRDPNNGEASNSMNDDFDGFSDDEFDDVEGEKGSYFDDGNSGQAGYSTDSSSGEAIYLDPLPGQPNKSFPLQPPKTLPNNPNVLPEKYHQSHSAHDKRPPMPLPHESGANQVLPSPPTNHRFGAPIGGFKLPPVTHTDPAKRLQQTLSNSMSEPPRRPPPVPGTPLPLASAPSNNLHKPYTAAPISIGPKPSGFPKKPFDSSTQNSRSETTNDVSGTIARLNNNAFLSERNKHFKMPSAPSSNFPPEDNGEYEVVESPTGNFLGNDVHRGNSPGQSQDPPPLPQRNPDGSNNRSGGSNLQPPSVGSNVGPSRPKAPAPPPISSPPVSLGPSSISQNRLSQSTKAPLQLKKSHSPERFPTLGVPNRGQPPLPPAPHLSQDSSLQNLGNPPLERAPAIPSTPAPPIPGGVPFGAERVPIGDGESIELTPLYRTLMERPFFHLISRSKSKQLLERADDGMFLIRPSTRSSDPLTLCLRYNRRTYNINIRQRRDGHYALGSEKTNEVSFKNIEEIVSTYTMEHLKLQSGDRVVLTNSPAKMDHIYVKLPSGVRKNY